MLYDYWDDMVRRVLRFKLQNGRLPGDSGSPGETVLDNWLTTQRRAAQQGRLVRSRQDVLDRKLGGWRRSNEDRWNARLAEVASSTVEGAPFTDTSREWLRQQRRALSQGSLAPHRKEALDRCLPYWFESSYVRWKAHADELAEYVARHGEVPGYTQGEDPVAILYRWLNYQRYLLKTERLPPERLEWLNENVPGWSPREAFRDGAWMTRAEQLARFVESTGRFPASTGDPEERRMVRWIETQRAAQRRNKLSEERATWLEAHIPGWNCDRRRNGGVA